MSELVANWELLGLTILLKMVLVGAFVVATTVLAERAGQAVGGLIATLPVVTGPVYFLLALDHDAPFIAASAGVSFAAMVSKAVMIVAYVPLAQRLKTTAAVGLSFAVWLCAVMAMLPVANDPAISIPLAVAVFCAGILFVRPYRGAGLSAKPASGGDLLIKGAGIAMVVGLVEIASLAAGPQMTGIFAAVPIALVAMMVLIQSRHGGPASAAVMAHALLGVAGISVAFFCLSVTAVPLGLAKALPLALLVSVGWNGALFALHALGPRLRAFSIPAKSN